MLVRRDKNKPNRYWFEFPAEWRTSNYEERIIGFRSLFIAGSARHILFKLIIDSNSTSTSYKINLILNYNDTLNTLADKIKAQLGEQKDLINIYSMSMADEKEENVIYQGKNYVAYNSKSDTETQGADSTTTLSSVLLEGQLMATGIRFVTFYTDTKIRITGLDDYAKALFNAKDYESNGAQTESYNGIVFYNLWDRHSCCLKSSLVSGITDNYLGYTNVRYNPLRYFKITSNDTKFYIDLYNGRLTHFYSILPYDDIDTITLELVIY
jgi:hypothetical protein